MTASILALVDDVFFLAKVRETAKGIGVRVIIPDPGRGILSITESQPQAIILDLNLRNAPAVEWIRTLKGDPATRHIPIVGFVSHVQTDLIAAARAEGCDLVLARSAFSQQLPDILRRFSGDTAGKPSAD